MGITVIMIKGYSGVGGFYRREFVDKIYSRFLTVHRSVNYTKVKQLIIKTKAVGGENDAQRG